MTLPFIFAAAFVASPAANAANVTNSAVGPDTAIIKHILLQKWDVKDSTYELSWGPSSQLQAVTNASCQPIYGWGDAKTPFHQVIRCSYTVSIKAPNGTPLTFDDIGLFERVDGAWRASKGPTPPAVAPTSPAHVSN